MNDEILRIEVQWSGFGSGRGKSEARLALQHTLRKVHSRPPDQLVGAGLIAVSKRVGIKPHT